ncbi:MAG TPA: hypothetical protein VNU02_02015, partial [Candidatus Dormibacteraeota bacterium]|nr:hypothetical protein [Candidatus Dormibacteraeota bacterium]
AQTIFDCAVDISLSNQQAGLDLQNVSACRAALEHRYGANADGIVRDAQAAVKRLVPDYQRGHQAVSFNEWARYTARADALATQGGQRG